MYSKFKAYILWLNFSDQSLRKCKYPYGYYIGSSYLQIKFTKAIIKFNAKLTSTNINISNWEYFTTKVVSSNPVHDEVYSIKHYVIKFVSDLRQVGGFFQVPLSLPPIKTDSHDITEILLKVALNTINQAKPILKMSGP
jgi:hypothetical protein